MIDDFYLIKTLGAGYHAKVKLAQDTNGNLYAIKKFKNQSSFEVLKNQLNIMKKLNHPNLVNLIQVRQKSIYKKKNGTTYNCFAIILQYVQGGELFEFLLRTGKFSSQVCRTMFTQLLDGLEHIHKQGIAHRDIKPQNTLLDKQFRVKIADFGFSCLKDKGHDGMLHTALGTQGYKAPQISSKNYVGEKVDIFAAGVVLFIMYTGTPPFEKAQVRDYYYKMIAAGKYDAFWNSHSKRKTVGFYTPSFKELMNKLLSLKPIDRPSIQQIMEYQWMKGDILMQNDIIQQFNARKLKIDQQMENERQQKLKSKGVMFGGAKFRGVENQQVSYCQQAKKVLNLDKQREIKLIRKSGKMDVEPLNIKPEDWASFYYDFVKKIQNCNIEISDVNYKLKGSIQLQPSIYKIVFKMQIYDAQQQQNSSNLVIKAQILKDEDGQLYNQISKIEGSSWHFFAVKKIVRQIIANS